MESWWPFRKRTARCNAPEEDQDCRRGRHDTGRLARQVVRNILGSDAEVGTVASTTPTPPTAHSAVITTLGNIVHVRFPRHHTLVSPEGIARCIAVRRPVRAEKSLDRTVNYYSENGRLIGD